jgi:hypothetical protein
MHVALWIWLCCVRVFLRSDLPGTASHTSCTLFVAVVVAARLRLSPFIRIQRGQRSCLANSRAQSVTAICPCCRALGKLTFLKDLWLRDATAPKEPCPAPGSFKFCPMLHKVQHIYLSSRSAISCSPLCVLACWTRIPATTRVCASYGSPWAPLDIKGWGQGWLPALLATTPFSYHAGGIILAVDDDGVDQYLSAVASMRPSQWPDCKHTLLLGCGVSDKGLSRLLGCTQQPPLRLEVDPAAADELEPYVDGWQRRLRLSAAHFRALCGLSAPRLVSLVVFNCEQVANKDVTMLAGTCHALKDLKLLGASKLTDPALFVLAAGCKQLQRVQVTHASVTEDGVVVALAMLGDLQRLEVGGMPVEWLAELQVLVAKQLAAANCLKWVAAGPKWVAAHPNVYEPSIEWSKQVGG